MAEETSRVTLDDVADTRSIETTSDQGSHRRRKRTTHVDLKCPLCEASVKRVTYKDVYQLKKFTSVRGKIISTEKSGVCAKHQRQLTRAIKRARYMALMPYVAMEA